MVDLRALRASLVLDPRTSATILRGLQAPVMVEARPMALSQG